MSEPIKNYYQGIYLTETVMGNPNGDFVDNSPRNFEGTVFTTDKCIKYNIRKYIHENFENINDKENIVFFFPRLINDANQGDAKFKTRDDVFKDYFNGDFDKLKKSSPDVRMFGGTFSFTNKDFDSKQIYGPIQLSYGIDINDAEIKRLQIGAPFATESGKQTTNGSESVVDDAIISYDITINPNNHKELLLDDDLDLFKKALWFGTNSRKSTSKKTDSKLLILIKFKNNSEDKVDAFCIGEINQLISVSNKKEHKMGRGIIELDCSKLKSKLDSYKNIESIEIICDDNEISLLNFYEDSEYINKKHPSDLL